MFALRDRSDLPQDLERLADALESLELGPDARSWLSERDRLAGTIRSYLVPRAIDPTAPMTVVFAGPTGSGKSTLINSVSGMDLSPTGALRPTTTVPVVLARPHSADRYDTIGGVPCEVITADIPILDSLVLVDAPDVDSNAPGHRAKAEALIDNADVVVFVTSALRYADDVPWQVLRRAASRGAPIIHVLNRVGSPSAGAVVDFKSRLASAGMGDRLISVPEHHLAESAHRVPAIAARSLRRRLVELVDDRDTLRARVFDRVLRATVTGVADLLRSIEGFGDETDDLGTELAVYLADRVVTLELEDVAVGLVPAPPSGRSRLAVASWKRRNAKLGATEIEQMEGTLVERIVSIVHGDLRHWLSGERAALREWNIEPADLIPGMLEVARSSVTGWVAFVARVAADHDSQHLWLQEATLLQAALTEDDLPTVDLLFAEDGQVLVERSRRELRGRLEHIYDRAGDLVVEAIRRRYGQVEDDELRASLGAVTSNLAPAHA